MLPLPRVSILIPSYKPQFFENALLSALAQTWPNVEILVSDNCPTEAIAEICARYPKVEYVRNPERGARGNCLHLIDRAGGDYLKFLLDDDLLHPLCVQQLMEPFMGTFGDDFTLSFSDRWRIDGHSRVIEKSPSIAIAGPEGGQITSTAAGLQVSLPAERTQSGALGIPGDVVIRMSLAYAANFIGELTTVLFRKADILRNRPDAFGFMGDRILGLGDIASSCFLASRGHVWYRPEALSFFRIHGAQNSNPLSNPDFALAVTDWALMVEAAFAEGMLSAVEASHGLRASVGNARPHLKSLPGLVDWSAKVMRRAEELEAEGQS